MLRLTITVVDNRVLNRDTVTTVCIPAISVLGRHRGVSATSSNVDIVKNDIGRVGNKVVVLGRVSQHQVGNDAVVETVNAKQDWTQRVDVRGVCLVPHLPVAVNGSSSVDEDIVASKLEERRHVLENKREGIRLPIVGIIGEENLALDIWR